MSPSPLPPEAVLFGSIGSLVESSDLQRRAFNAAFLEAGLAWEWTPEIYAPLLRGSGGRARIEAYAARTGAEVDAEALHRRKSEIFRTMIAEAGLPLRSGVPEVLEAARAAGCALGAVSTTSRGNVDDLLAHARPPIGRETFDVMTTAEDVARPKPAPDAYAYALSRLGLPAEAVIAVEDSPQSAEAARAAGIATVAFPGAYHADRPFEGVVAVLDRLTPDALGLTAAVRQAG